MRPLTFSAGPKRLAAVSVVLVATFWIACRSVVVVPVVPRCVPLTQGARTELMDHCSIPATTNPQGALVLCPNIEAWLGDIDRYCAAIDVLSGYK